MTELFVPYEESKALRDLGFNEECLTTYLNGELETKEMFFFTHTFRSHETQEFISAPLYSQAFKWFREKHSFNGTVNSPYKAHAWTFSIDNITTESQVTLEVGFLSYEEAELACLKKLIEITKQK